MQQVPTTSSSENSTTTTVSSASPSSAPSIPIQKTNNCMEKRLQSVSNSESKDEKHGEPDQIHLSGLFDTKEEMSEDELFSLDKDELWEDLSARFNSIFLGTGTDDTYAGQSTKGGPDTTHRQLEGEAAAALPWTRAEIKNVNNTLAEACKNGDIDVVRKLLHEGRSVNETSENNISLLSIACSAGHYELAPLLLAMKADVEDRVIKENCTPLMEAAYSGFVDIVRLLLAHGAVVNALSIYGNTPLMFACAEREHFNYGATIKAYNENERISPDGAESTGHLMVVKILIEHRADINHFNKCKESALTLACSKGHIDIVRVLLAGADQEHETKERHTALMKASIEGHIGIARLLLESGSPINKAPDGFHSPLTLAASYGHVQLALLLIDSGAKIEEVNIEVYTPLMLAARGGHKDMVSVLLSKGANINGQYEGTQETASSLACYGGFLDVAKLLIENGAKLDFGSPTPLIEASEEGHIEIIRYLVECGANVHAQDEYDTDFPIPYKHFDPDIADLLLQLGATFVSKR